MSFLKSLPFTSQVISVAQLIAGDVEGARETQEIFSRRCPVVSQVRSAVLAASGDLEGARQTQEEFSRTCPIIAQARSVVEVANGDVDGALETQQMFLGAVLWEEKQPGAAADDRKDNQRREGVGGSALGSPGGSRGSRGSQGGKLQIPFVRVGGNEGSSDMSELMQTTAAQLGTDLPSSMSKEELEAYILALQLKNAALESEAEAAKDVKLCVVCLEIEKQVMFKPCGHAACCMTCGSDIEQCPLCRAPVLARDKIFL